MAYFTAVIAGILWGSVLHVGHAEGESRVAYTMVAIAATAATVALGLLT